MPPAPAGYYASLRTFYQRLYGPLDRLALALLLRLFSSAFNR